MAEALTVERRTSPQEGHSTAQMTHPSVRIREFLKKEHRHGPPSNGSHTADTESGNSGDEQRAQDNQSPPPNCSICLGRVKSKCFTDSCMHQFCFSCLLEWSKVKPECPLCKQTFKSIIHNVTSMDSYDEYKIEEQHRHVNWINIPNTMQPLNFILSANLPTYRVAINRVQRPDLQNRIYQLFLNETPLTERFARAYGNDMIPPRYAGAQWRGYCYHRRLHAVPIVNDGQFGPHARTITAQFYRENPAQVHRLIPWLNRELVTLCPATPDLVPQLVQSIEGLIKTHDMTSREFRRRVRVFVPNHTDHFVHELINFARSPYDIVGYDRNVVYNPVFEDDRVIMLSSSSSDESDIEFVIDARMENLNNLNDAANNGQSISQTMTSTATSAAPPTMTDSSSSFTVMLRRNLRSTPMLMTPIVYETDSGDEEITNYLQTRPAASNEEIIRGRAEPIAATASTRSTVVDANQQNSGRTSESQSVIVSLNRNANQSPATTSSSVVTHTSAIISFNGATAGASTTLTNSNSSNDSDSDDCQFVCAKKPPHLRTPEYVELNSESDSDVVFVDETVVTSQVIKTEKNGKNKATTSAASTSTSIVPSGRRKRRHRNDEAHTSAGGGECVNVSDQADEQNANRPRDYTSAACAAMSDAIQTAIDIKPSTSADMYQSANRPNAIVYNQNSNIPPIKMRFTARKTASMGKRIYEMRSSSSDDEKSSDAHVSTSSSSTANSSNQSEDIQSSSHEEYAEPAAIQRRNTSGERSMRKRYRKKANVKQIAARKKKKNSSMSPPKPKRMRQCRSKRTKKPVDTTSSSSDSSSDPENSN